MSLSIVEKLVFLRQAPLLRELSSEALLLVARLAEQVELAAGDVLFREGEPGGRMFVVVRGRIRISTARGSGDEALAFLAPGAVLGEMAIFADELRSATAAAEEPATLLVFDGADVTELVTDHPVIALAFLKQMAQRVTESNRLVAATRSGTG